MNRHRIPWLIFLLLGWVTFAGIWLAARTSMTTDEGIHVASAYLALTRGSHRFDPEHPFLFKYATALPVVAYRPNHPPDDQVLWQRAEPTFFDSWRESREWSDQWFYTSGNNADRMIFLARLPAVATLVALCWFTYFLSLRWFGETAARWALFFTAFNPTLLAHGSTANTDVPLALSFLLALWALWLYWKQPSWQRAAWVGVALGLALTTKFSAIYLLPISFLWFAYTALWFRPRLNRPWLTVTGQYVFALLLVWMCIWTVYGWQSPVSYASMPDTNQARITQEVIASYNLTPEKIGNTLRWLAPTGWTKGIVMSMLTSAIGRPTYILGTVYTKGVWFYFPLIFFLKTQFIAIWIALTGIGYYAFRILRVRHWQPISALLIMATAVVAILSFMSKLNLGIRHISPLLPLFSITLAIILTNLPRILLPRWIIGFICVAYIVPVFAQQHNLIGFGNILVTPPATHYKYFHDSNLDWGQDSQAIARVMQERYPGKTLYINYPWSPYAITYYGVPQHRFDPLNPPQEGISAVSALHLAATASYREFRDRQPDYVLNGTTFFYRNE